MNNKRTISVMQVTGTDTLLVLFREQTGNVLATSGDLFTLLSTPSPERDVFLGHCACTFSSIDNIVLSTYTPK